MASVSQEILDGVISVINSLPLTLGTVEARKSDVLHKSDTLPAIIVWIEENAGPAWGTTGSGGEDYGIAGNQYRCKFAIYRQFLGLNQTNIDSNPDLVRQLKEAFLKPSLEGCERVWNVTSTPHPQIEVGQLREGVEGVKLALMFHVTESLNGY